MDIYLSIDVGSMTAKCAIITGVSEFIADNHLYIQGKPTAVFQRGLGEVGGQLLADVRIRD